ncbi:alpha-galactosidase, partial [Opisthorchis viverrini]
MRPLVILCTVLLNGVFALENGLARTPPMGWMSWERFRCQTDCVQYPEDCISEKLIRRTVDRMISDGWKDVGYEYVITDDCWPEKERDRNTQEIVADQTRFPSVSDLFQSVARQFSNVLHVDTSPLCTYGQLGMRLHIRPHPGTYKQLYTVLHLMLTNRRGIEGLGEYIHGHGLKFGIYLDYGTMTCAGYPGSMDFLEIDTKSLAKWKVDYVKVDGCYSPLDEMPEGYEKFGELLNQTGRPIVYSCSYPAYIPWRSNPKMLDWQRLKTNCNLWRMFGDIDDSWDSVLTIINLMRDTQSTLQPIAGPGHWNDPDMLVIGDFGLSLDQERVQMGMWCLFAAPLLISADMDHMNPESAAILKNPHLISINQDSGGHQAKYITTKNGVQLWTRLLADQPNTWAIAFMNPISGGGPKAISVSLKEMQLESPPPEPVFFDLIDVFDGEVFTSVQLNEKFTVRVNPTGIVMFKVEVHKPAYIAHILLHYLGLRNV